MILGVVSRLLLLPERQLPGPLRRRPGEFHPEKQDSWFAGPLTSGETNPRQHESDSTAFVFTLHKTPRPASRRPGSFGVPPGARSSRSAQHPNGMPPAQRGDGVGVTSVSPAALPAARPSRHPLPPVSPPGPLRAGRCPSSDASPWQRDPRPSCGVSPPA